MSDKQTLSRWLRTKEVYEDNRGGSDGTPWREGLLAEFDATIVRQKVQPETAPTQPIELRHILLMAPVGVGLFLGGWLLGSGSLSLEKLNQISPLVWILGAVGGSLAFVLNRGLKFGRWS